VSVLIHYANDGNHPVEANVIKIIEFAPDGSGFIVKYTDGSSEDVAFDRLKFSSRWDCSQ
jgi:hypothetical protein